MCIDLCIPSLKHQELHLSRNSVGPDGARQLAQGLGSDCSLRLLDLSSCKLRAEGVAHIATSLAVNKCLTSLSLDRCEGRGVGSSWAVDLMRNQTGSSPAYCKLCWAAGSRAK